MNRCPEHPDKDTMVPCLGCGRSFCRICNPSRGAGQLCPSCHKESVSQLVAKTVEEPAEKTKPSLKFWKKSEWVMPRKERDYQAFFRSSGDKLVHFPGRVIRFLIDHVPVGLTEKKKTGGMPPMLKSWYKLLIVVFAGTLLWVMVVALLQRRTPLISILTALVISIGVILAFNGRLDWEVGIIAASFALLALGLGEVIIYILYRSKMVESLNVVRASLNMIDNPFSYFIYYSYNLLMMRIIPACIVAFTLAVWPFSKRPSWRGFKSHQATV